MTILLLLVSVSVFTQYMDERSKMVKWQIKSRGIKDSDVLRAMDTVPRHKFVPDNLVNQAYEDRPLYIGHGQTISQPYIVAYMTEIVAPRNDMKVLEIGTGSGYQAAVLSEIVDMVYSIEIIEPLGQRAIDRLQRLKYNNVEVKLADGYYGWEEHSPFDAIVVTAAAEHIPPPLIKQLREGGKMIIPVGSPFQTQKLVLVEKKNGEIRTKNLMFVRFVPFTRGKGN